MRIQHNIAALNSYRNLTTNNNALAKNLEKLSSGYRINRAGDDAAGLAISEKMRAQITGLETAQKNANDGISLVQTAEGALTEVHSMLNRMVELANQSANGTYADEVDRENLQAEVNSLKDEINRISKATNFNGLNLLDGSMGQTTTAADDAATGFQDITAAALTHVADGAMAEPSVKGQFTLDLTSLEMRNDGVSATVAGGAPTVAGTNGTDESAAGAGDATKANITASFTGITVELPEGATEGKVKINIGGTDFEIDYQEGDTAGQMDAKKIAAALIGKEIKVGDVTLTAVAGADDESVKFEAADAGATTGVDAITAGTVKGGLTDASVSAKVTIGSTTLNGVDIEPEKTMTGAKWAEEFMKTLTDGKTTIDNIEYEVTNNNGKLTFTMVDDPKEDFTNDLKAKVEVFAGADKLAAAGVDAASGDANVDHDNDKGVFINQGNGIGVHIDKQAKYGGDRVLAQATLDLGQIGQIKDGTALKIGNETYIFAVGKESKFDKNAANVIDMTNKEKVETADLVDASQKLSKVAANNKMFDVSTDNTTGVVRLTERKDSGIDYTINNLEGTSKKDLLDGGVTAANWKDLVQVGVGNPDAKPAVTSGGLVLQIGDTSDDFNKMTVSIGSMSADALGIGGVDISTQDGAAAAVDQIKAAINKVSSQRGDLGAIQNRLEHTINNLSVTAENITAAESRIRDVDMAKEMMAYTKNNILVQASQAMLAQANQVPQGVLQLLQ